MQWALILCYTRTLEDTHGTLYLATGNVKCLQIIGGGLMLLNIPIDYVFLKQGFEPIITMIIGAVFGSCDNVCCVHVSKENCEISYTMFLQRSCSSAIGSMRAFFNFSSSDIIFSGKRRVFCAFVWSVSYLYL